MATQGRRVAVIGAGIVAWSCAWLLQGQGHRVTLIAPEHAPAGGSLAALGVLMARVFHRTGGRAWRLRQRSLELWDQWCTQLADRGHPLALRRGLLLLAADPREQQRLQHLAGERQGLEIAWWEPDRLAGLTPALPAGALGALHSAADGQIDPRLAMAALQADAQAAGLERLHDQVMALERTGDRWQLRLLHGPTRRTDYVVLAAGLGSAALLAPLGHGLALEPVLGQAAAIRLMQAPAWNWPAAAAVWRGVNLVPRPDLLEGHGLWLGATLEPGDQADPTALAELRTLEGAAPPWLEQAATVASWHGLRCRPLGQPAPVLASPEPGLLVATGHHRNGVLLAPATAEWVLNRIEA